MGSDVERLEAAIGPAESLENILKIMAFCARMDIQMRVKCARIKKEREMIQEVDRATMLRDTKVLREVLTQCLALGFDVHHPALIKASTTLGELESEVEKREMAEKKAKAEEEARLKRTDVDQRLRAAIMDEDVTEIETVLKLATAIGYYESPDMMRHGDLENSAQNECN